MKKITAVVTTFNSSNVIGRLLDGLLKQSYALYQIIIVDNNSNDDTCFIIDGFDNPKIHLHQLGKNLGGAGGFAKGFELAQATGCDLIISFDDDAYVLSDDFLKDLVDAKESGNYDVVAPLVVDSHNTDLSAYEYKINRQKLINVYDIQKNTFLDNEIKLFNGVLFDKKVVQTVGIPNALFFIRGDEQDYKIRILNQGFKTAVFTKALVYHPSSLDEYFYIKDRRYHHLDSSFKLFFSVRNHAYMLKKRQDIGFFKKSKIAYRHFMRYTWFYLIHQKNIKQYYIWLKAFIFGLLGYMKNQKQ